MEFIQKIIALFEDIRHLFDSSIFSAINVFLKTIFNIIVAILYFLIDVLKWIIGKL